MNKLVFIILLLFSNHIFSQYIYSDTTWERWYGVQNEIELSGTFKHDIEHYDKGYIFHGYDGGFVTYNVYLKKTDINGYYLWERRLDVNYKKTILSIKNYNDGGLIICGASEYNGVPNPWVAKLNACMEVEWCYIFSWPEFSYTNDIAEDHDGNIIVLTLYYGNTPDERIGLIKIAPDGEVLWKKNYATRYDYPYIWDANGYHLLISNDNHYYISGEAYWPTNNDPEQGGGFRSFFIKVDSNGEEEWVLPFGIYDNLYSAATTSRQLSDDLFLSVGINWDSSCPLFMYYNSEGEALSFVSKRIMPETYDLAWFSSSEMINTNLFFTIWRYAYDAYDTPLTGYVVCDSLLNIISYEERPEILMPGNLIKTFNNKIVTVAHVKEQDDPTFWDTYLNKQNTDLTYDSVYTAWPGTYDSLCEGGVVSGFLPYSCDEIVGIDEIPSPEQYKEAQEKIAIQVQPNPGVNQATLLLENTAKFQNIELEIFNIAGEQQYYRKLLSGIGEISLNIANWPQGMYFIIIRSQGKMVGDAKLNVVR